MHAFSAAETLRMWERGVGLPAGARALSLLDGVLDGKATESLGALSIGERDNQLIQLRQSLFGRQLNSLSECPHCGLAVEFALDAAELRNQSPCERPPTYALGVGNVSVHYRLLKADDLTAISGCNDIQAARLRLVERCVLQATQDDIAIAAADLPEAVVQELSKQLALADKQAEIALDLNCPECDQSWSAVFDIASFLWVELDVLAKQLLGEVHTLAWSYGWSEADILTMSDARRHYYLSLVQSCQTS